MPKGEEEAVGMVQIFVRLYPGQDDDLIAWYTSPDTPRGWKAQTVRDTLRLGIEAGDQVAQLRRELRELRQTVQGIPRNQEVTRGHE
jgi:hypothetical protein